MVPLHVNFKLEVEALIISVFRNQQNEVLLFRFQIDLHSKAKAIFFEKQRQKHDLQSYGQWSCLIVVPFHPRL